MARAKRRRSFKKAGPSSERYRGNFSAIYIAQSMWNHGDKMAEVMRAAGIAWPRFASGEVADLSAFLLVRRGWVPPPAPRSAKTTPGR